MATVTYPGVYIEEVSSGVRPLDAGTSTAAFVGLAERGPQVATRVTSWNQFQRLYGGFIADSRLAHSVLQYFNNGGGQCYIVRVIRDQRGRRDGNRQEPGRRGHRGDQFASKNPGNMGQLSLPEHRESPTIPATSSRSASADRTTRRLSPKHSGITGFGSLRRPQHRPVGGPLFQTIIARDSVFIDARPPPRTPRRCSTACTAAGRSRRCHWLSTAASGSMSTETDSRP